MINWPNIGLYGEFSNCEEGMVEAINRNFFIIDSVMQLKVIDFVETLPASPQEGDVYIVEDPTYIYSAGGSYLMMYNGSNWIQIIPKTGFLAFVESLNGFYWFNGSDWLPLPMSVDDIKLKLARATSTGVLDGLVLSVNTLDNTKFDISAGLYEIVDMTDINNPLVYTVTYPGSTGNSVTNLSSQNVTYISLDKDQVVHQSATYPSPDERRSYAFTGRVNHNNRTSISFADTFPDYKVSPVSSFYDLVDALAPFKMDEGLKPTPNGSNLSLDISAGSVFFRSDNYSVDKNNPHTKTYGSMTVAPLRKMTSTTTVDSSDVTVIEPNYYDAGGVRTLIPGGNSVASIQRIYKYKSGAIRVQYGATLYNNISAAMEGILTDEISVNSTVEQTAVLIGYLVVTKGCTDLSATADAKIIPANRFGGAGGAGGGGGGSGIITVADITARNAIGSGSRVAGETIVYVTSEQKTYQLVGGITNSDWQALATDKNTLTLTNKDIDGGTASATSRITVPKTADWDSKQALNYKLGNIILDDSNDRLNVATDGTYKELALLDEGNLIANPRGDTGADEWFQVEYSGGARPTGTPTPNGVNMFVSSEAGSLSGIGQRRFRIDKVAQNFQGKAVEIVMPIPEGYRTSVLSLEILYKTTSPDFIAGSETTDSSLIFYCAESSDGVNYTVKEPSSFKILTKGIPDTLRSYIQVGPSTTHLKLIAYCARSEATEWTFDFEAKVSKTQYAFGSIIADLGYMPLAPVTGAGGGNLVIGTGGGATYSARVLRVGTDAFISYKLRIGTSGASDASGTYQFPLPTGLVEDSSVHPTDTVVGYGDITNTSTRNPVTRVIARMYGGKIVLDATDSLLVASGGAQLFNNTNTLSFDVKLKIQGWSSGAQLSDGYDGTIIAAGAYRISSDQSGVNPNNSRVKIQVNGLGVNNLDTVSGFDFTNNRYNIKSSGVYDIDASIYVLSTNVLSSDYTLQILVNGTTPYTLDLIKPVVATQFVLKGSLNVPLVAGDYVEVFIFGSGNNSSNTLTIGSGNTTRLLISKKSGSAFMSPTASLYVMASNVSGQSLTGLANNTITGWVKTLDSFNAFNASTGIFTAPEAGRFMFGGRIRFAASAGVVGSEINATTIGAGMFIESTSNIIRDLSGFRMFDLKQGDTVPYTVYTEAARSLSTQAGATTLYIYKVK